MECGRTGSAVGEEAEGTEGMTDEQRATLRTEMEATQGYLSRMMALVERWVDRTARECAEIAERLDCCDCGHASMDEMNGRSCLETVADDIRERFGLEGK